MTTVKQGNRLTLYQILGSPEYRHLRIDSYVYHEFDS